VTHCGVTMSNCGVIRIIVEQFESVVDFLLHTVELS
jgi:hypothetical protein